MAFGVALLWPTPGRGAEGSTVVEKSEGTAVLLSVAGVLGPLAAASLVPELVVADGSRPRQVIGVGLLALGATWGTSLGYAYAGDLRHALFSGFGKAALIGAAAGGAALYGARSEVVDDPMGAVMFSAAFIAVAIWDVVDVIRVPAAVRRHNQRAAVTLLPLRLRDGWGAAVASRF